MKLPISKRLYAARRWSSPARAWRISEPTMDIWGSICCNQAGAARDRVRPRKDPLEKRQRRNAEAFSVWTAR